ncbi:MAG: class I SAM-dependent RNA methyltransferase [Rhodospirillaceae bacterium]|nr:class I SAM-dependent RNA methyltransferase [Rhodospirillaceae bacterium]
MAADLLIHELGASGDGVHKSDSGPVYVERALPGESVQANIHNGAGGVLRGDLTRVITASPQRITAPCPNYDACGGCSLQHVSDNFYRNWKVDVVRSALDKKGLKPDVWREPVFLPAGTRRRATFVAVKKNNAVMLGYFRRRTHHITDIATCLVLDPALMKLREGLVTLLAPILQGGKTADIFIQSVDGQCEVVITGPVGKKGTPDLPVFEAIAQLAHTLKISRVSWRARERDTPEVMLELNPLRATFGKLDVALPPLAFLQPTKLGEAVLVGAVMELLPNSGTFADLFSGCGTFSGAMLERGRVDAFDNIEPAIRALDKAKGAQPLKATQRDLFRNPLQTDEANTYDAIVFDPPRAGAHEQVKALAASKTPLIVGVSCNPATFARDARILVDGGYKFESIKVVDQFTWSHHIELIAAFTKRS